LADPTEFDSSTRAALRRWRASKPKRERRDGANCAAAFAARRRFGAPAIVLRIARADFFLFVSADG
jgi:hypothetical protein